MLFIYYSSVILRLLLKFVYSREIKERAKREGYVFKKKGESLTKKSIRFIKECLITFVPIINTLSVFKYLVMGLENSYEKAITNGVSNGCFVKSSGPVVENKSIFDQTMNNIEILSRNVRNKAEKHVNNVERYLESLENKINGKSAKNNLVPSKFAPSSDSRMDELVAQSDNGRSIIAIGGSKIDEKDARALTIKSEEQRVIFSSYDNMSIQEKLAYLENERLEAKSLQSNEAGFSREMKKRG